MAAVSFSRERDWSDAIGERVAYAPDGRAWACSSRQVLQLFEDDEPATSATVAGELLSELAFSSDGARVLVAPRVYDRAAGDWEPRAPIAEALATGLDPVAAEGFAAVSGAWAQDGSALAVYAEYRPPRGLPARAGWDGPSARVVLLDDGHPSVLWEGERSEPRGAIVVGDTLVACGGRAVDVRERSSGRPIVVLEPLRTVARILRLDAGRGRVAAGAADGTVAVWETEAWGELGRWEAHRDEAAALAWHPDGAAIATGGADGAVRLWSPSGEPLGEIMLAEPVTGLAFRADGTRLLAAHGAVTALALSG